MNQHKDAAHHLQLYLCDNINKEASKILRQCTKIKELHNWNFWFENFKDLNVRINDNLFNQSFNEAAELLFVLDADLSTVAKKCQFASIPHQLKAEIVAHFHACFCLHGASLLLHRKQDISTILQLLVLSTEVEDIHLSKLRNLSKESLNCVKYLQKESKLRLLQAVSLLETNISKIERNDVWINLKACVPVANDYAPCQYDEIVRDARRLIDDTESKVKMHQNLFGHIEIEANGSYWISSILFGKKILQADCNWPATNDIEASELKTIIQLAVVLFKTKKDFLEEAAVNYFSRAKQIMLSSNIISNITEREYILMDEAITFLAARYIKNGEINELIDLLNELNLPFAKFFMFVGYTKLAENSEIRKENRIGIKENGAVCLKQTNELLEKWPNHPLKLFIHRYEISDIVIGENSRKQTYEYELNAVCQFLIAILFCSFFFSPFRSAFR